MSIFMPCTFYIKGLFIMETIVLKFGGSSVADNIKLNIVANKIIDFYNKGNKVIVVVSAQGKTTDGLIKEAKELSYEPDKREMDVLLSTGEQISSSKLAMLLKRLGYKAVSLTGWQAGIYTSNTNEEAKIEYINTERIENELEDNKIVVIAGFQGINDRKDITTLGRGGSDTTAVAVAAAIKADHCYIFSDVDGVYSTDPNKITAAKKIEELSYDEMLDLSNEGAKVLHNRCVEIAQKFNVLIETGSTFNNNIGTQINDKIEESTVKSIVKNDNLFLITLKYENYNADMLNKLYTTLLNNGIVPTNIINNSTNSFNISFTIKTSELGKFQELLETELNMFSSAFTNISRISLVGYGIMNNTEIMKKTLEILNINSVEIFSIQLEECKLSIMLKEKISNKLLEQLHHELIK